MSAEKLFALGAEPVAGTVYLNHKEVGKFTSQGFVLLPAGEAALAEAAVEDAPPPAPKSKAAKAAKAAEPPPAIDEAAELDALLNG